MTNSMNDQNYSATHLEAAVMTDKVTYTLACCVVGIALCRTQISMQESKYFAKHPSLAPNAE